MIKATREVSRVQPDNLPICKRFSVSVKVVLHGCEAMVEPTCIRGDKMAESLSSDVEAAKWSIFESIWITEDTKDSESWLEAQIYLKQGEG